VVHVWHDVATAKSELTALLNGEHVRPLSGLGSNTDATTPTTPRAIIVGAGFTRSELDEMRNILNGDSVPWLYPGVVGMASTAMAAMRGNFMESIVNRAKSTMKKNGLVEGNEGSVKPDVWIF
jgi:hypothetical protein